MQLSCIGTVSSVVLFFFFQAEDGIRDVAVTGVQTCALPICLDLGLPRAQGPESRPRRRPNPTKCPRDRKSTRLNSSHGYISYAVFCLKKKKTKPSTYSRKTPAIMSVGTIVLRRRL